MKKSMGLERCGGGKRIHSPGTRWDLEAWNNDILIAGTSTLRSNDRGVVCLCDFVHHAYKSFIPAISRHRRHRRHARDIGDFSGIADTSIRETWLVVGNAGDIEREFESGDEDIEG